MYSVPPLEVVHFGTVYYRLTRRSPGRQQPATERLRHVLGLDLYLQ